MTSAQVRAEQKGETVTPLPVPEDPQYRVPMTSAPAAGNNDNQEEEHHE